MMQTRIALLVLLLLRIPSTSQAFLSPAATKRLSAPTTTTATTTLPSPCWATHWKPDKIAHELQELLHDDDDDNDEQHQRDQQEHAKVQRLVQDLDQQHQDHQRWLQQQQQQQQNYHNNDNIKATHSDQQAYWQQAHAKTSQQLHDLRDSVQYWKTRYEQLHTRLQHERQHHRQQSRDLKAKLEHAVRRNNSQSSNDAQLQPQKAAADHNDDMLLQRLALRDMELCSQKVALHQAEKRMARILETKNQEIQALQDQLHDQQQQQQQQKETKRGGWWKRLRSWLTRANKTEEEREEDFLEHYWHEDVYMEY